jgi:hypothetical protein
MSRDPLWQRLVDDAAVFPPGDAPWPQALTEHRAHRRSGYGEMVGPLLVPAGRAGALLEALDAAADRDPIAVGLIGDLDRLVAALELLARRAPQVEVVAAELPPVPEDGLAPVVEAAVDLGLPAVWLEVQRGPDGARMVSSLADHHSDVTRVGAKLRTGGTTADAAPSVGDLALFLRTATAASLPFKLTAGLHHAVRGHDPVTGGTTHGVLNVVAAVDALLSGIDEQAVTVLLEQTDGAALGALVSALPSERRRAVRSAWASFGCCGVTDPLRELAVLGLVPHHDLVPSPIHQEVT